MTHRLTRHPETARIQGSTPPQPQPDHSTNAAAAAAAQNRRHAATPCTRMPTHTAITSSDTRARPMRTSEHHMGSSALPIQRTHQLVGRRRLPHTQIFIRLHRHISERDAGIPDAQARELGQGMGGTACESGWGPHLQQASQLLSAVRAPTHTTTHAQHLPDAYRCSSGRHGEMPPRLQVEAVQPHTPSASVRAGDRPSPATVALPHRCPNSAVHCQAGGNVAVSSEFWVLCAAWIMGGGGFGGSSFLVSARVSGGA